MTEEQYTQLSQSPQLAGLPIYEESDQVNCEKLDRVEDVHEATTVAEVHTFLADKNLVPQGAIRFQHDTGTSVRFYFHKRFPRSGRKRA
jgi:hypothetical protein